MTSISYSQNLEDVLLKRALVSVENGFYIDVGAADPEEYSVTKAFYDSGWHGINVEPDREYVRRLRDARPRDTNLELALGAEPSRKVLHNFTGTGLSTFDDALAARFREAGHADAPLEVEVVSLAEVCRKYASGDIHFLKIDVEGAERAVLEGADFRAHRPWIVVVEAIEPLSRRPSHESWEALLLNADYCFVWFDGLNRFYVARERLPLRGGL
jgi:FkbM family methyltransferase